MNENQKLEVMPPEVAVEVNDRVVGEKEAIEALQRECGMVAIRPTTIRDLETMGIHMKGVGVLKIQRGQTMAGQQRLSMAMAQVSKLMTEISDTDTAKNKKKVDQVCRLAAALGDLVRKQMEAGRLAVDIERSVSPAGTPTEEPSPEQLAFVPGQPVKVRPLNITQVNIHKG